MPRRMSACPDSVNIDVRALRGRLSLWNSMEGNLGEERKRKDNKQAKCLTSEGTCPSSHTVQLLLT